MMKSLNTYIPAAGTASRLGGIPKFYLPVKDNQSLIGNHIKNLNKLNNNKIIIGTHNHFFKSIKNLYPEANVKEIVSSSMVETVKKLGLSKTNDSLVVMPDTYFFDYEVVKRMRTKLISSDADIVLGLWKIRNDQKGKLGQCVIEKGFIKKIIDKNRNCKEKYFWGLIMWGPQFNKYILNSDKHFGISLNRAIANNLKVTYSLAKDKYFDCGTFDEYKFMLKNIK